MGYRVDPFTVDYLSWNGLGTGGIETMPRPAATTTGTTASQALRLTYFTAWKSVSVSTAIVSTGSTAAGATPTLIRIGLWTATDDGSLTALVASTANDTALLAGTSTEYAKALSSSYTTVAGQRYAAGLLIVTAAATPTIQGFSANTGATIARAPRLAGTAAGQADLPNTFSGGSLTTSNTFQYIGFV